MDNRRKKVILVFPRFKYSNGDIPIGLATLATVIKTRIKHISISVIDGGFANLNFIEKIFRSQRPGIVGIYMDTLMYEDAIRVANIAKNYGANVIIGGPHPTLLPETVIFRDSVDAVCLGEGENVLPQYIESYYEGKSFFKIKGIWFKYHNQLIKNEIQEKIENLDMLPRLDLEMFNIEKYIKNWIHMNSYNPNLRGISVMVSRGCQFNCSYCQPVLDIMFGKKLRIYSPEKVIDDLIYWKNKYKLQAFYFQDSNLTLFNDWLKKFCNLVLEKKLNIMWVCNSRVDTINLELLDYMREAGCRKIRFGIESTSDRILNNIYNKKITLDMVRTAINMTKKKGIQTSGYFILGGPTESEEEIKNTIDFASRSGLDEAVFTIFSPLPGTYLYNRAISESWNLPKKFGDFNYYVAKRVKLLPSDISSKKLNFYKKIAFLKFYCYPKRFRKTLSIVLNRSGFLKTVKNLITYFL